MSSERTPSVSAEAFRGLVERLSTEALFLVDAECRIASWGTPVARLTGYSADESLGRGTEFLWDDTEGCFQASLPAADGGVISSARSLITRSGGRIPVEVAVSHLPERAGGGYGVRIVPLEGRRRSAAPPADRSLSAAQDTARLLEAVAQNTTDALFVKDRDGRYLLFNEAAARFVGKTAVEVIGQDDTALFDPESARTIQTLDRSVMERNAAVTTEEHVTAAGVTRTFLATKAPYRDAAGNVVGLIGISRDITDRKQRELRIQAIEQRLREAQRIAGMGSWLWEPPTGRVWWSDEIYRLFGYETGEVEPTYDLFLAQIHRDDRDGVHRRIEAIVAGGDWVEHEFRIMDRDGRQLWINSCGRATRDAHGNLVLLEGTDQDITPRKQSEEKLRRNHAFLEAIIQHAGEGISVARFAPPPRHVEILFWNSRMTELTGYACEEINERGWFSTMYPDPEMQRRAVDRLERVRSGEQLRSEEWEFETRRGEIKTVSVSTSTVEGDDGESVLIGLYSDVTDRRKAEAELRASEARFRTFIDHASDAMFLHAAGGRVLDANRQACESLGYSREELIGRMPEDFDDELNEASKRRVEERLMGGQPATFDSRHRRKDGSTFPVEVRRSPFQIDGEWLSLSIIRDITDRKRAEERLLESEQRLRALADAIPQIVWSSGPDGAIDHFNAWTEKYSGIPAAELNGWSWGQAIHPEDLPMLLDAWTEIIHTGVPRAIEFRIRRHDGEYRWHMARQAAGRRPDGTIDRWYGTCTDIDDQKRIESALRDERDRFAKLAETAPGVLHSFRVRPDGTASFPYSSPRIAEIFGFRPEELRNDARPAAERIHPDDLPRFTAALDRSLQTMSDWRCTFRVNHPTRGEIWVEGHSSPVREPDGGLLWHGFLSDVTERKRSEESLIDSETRFRRFMNSGPQIAFLKDGEGRYLYVNDNFQWIVHRPLSDVLGRTDFDLFPPQIAAEFRRNDLRALESGRLIVASEFAPQADGMHESIVYKFPLADRDGRTLLGGMAIDVTEQRQSEELLRAVMASVTDAIISMDARGAVRSVNAATSQLLGLPESQIIGQSLPSLIPDAFSPQFPSNDATTFLERVSAIGGSRRGFEVRRADGSTFPAEFALSEFRIRGERRFTGVLRDITEHKRLEEQFRQSQKMQAVGQLASGVAHDLNNLLTVIYGYCFLLLQELPADSSGREAVQAIRDAGMRAASLTRQLLTFSRKTIVRPKVLNLNAVVDGIGRMLDRVIGDDIRLTTRLSPKTPWVKMDPVQIEQVLMNFAVNARDAMLSGGELTIETGDAHLRPQDCRFYPDCRPGRYARLMVSDTGEGMDEDVRSRVFEPFFTTKPVGKGTGLGLATVFGIVKQAGGHVAVESRRGHGAQFTVLLPATSEACEPQRASPLPSHPRGAETILLVEDDREVRRLTADILDRLGYRVLEAESASDAIRLFDAMPGKIDLLLTDVVMPEIGGRPLADILRGKRALLKVVFVTGHADDEGLRQLAGMAAETILQKPFDPQEFAHRIRAALDEDAAARRR